MVLRKEKVYSFRSRKVGVRYSIPHVTLKDAKKAAVRKWGKEVVTSSGRINKKLTKRRYKMKIFKESLKDVDEQALDYMLRQI